MKISRDAPLEFGLFFFSFFLRGGGGGGGSSKWGVRNGTQQDLTLKEAAIV